MSRDWCIHPSHPFTCHALLRKGEILPRASPWILRDVGDNVTRKPTFSHQLLQQHTHTHTHTYSQDCPTWQRTQACADALPDSSRPVQTTSHTPTLPRDLRHSPADNPSCLPRAGHCTTHWRYGSEQDEHQLPPSLPSNKQIYLKSNFYVEVFVCR